MPAASCAWRVPPAVAAPAARSAPAGAVVCRPTPAHRWPPVHSGSRQGSKPPPDRRRHRQRDHRQRSNRSRCPEFHSRSSALPASRAGDSRLAPAEPVRYIARPAAITASVAKCVRPSFSHADRRKTAAVTLMEPSALKPRGCLREGEILVGMTNL
jgi:hypothetical protein